MDDYNDIFIAEFGMPQWLTIAVAPVAQKAKPFWKKIVEVGVRAAHRAAAAGISAIPVAKMAVPVAVAGATVLWGAWRLSTRQRPKRYGPQVIDAVDADGETGAVVDHDGVVGATVDGWGAATDKGLKPYMALAGVIARVVKVKMGVPKDTPANRMVAWELCGKELVARNVRKCDVAKFQSLAHRLVFIPSKWDVLIEEAMASDEVAERFAPQSGRRGFWSWLLRYKEERRRSGRRPGDNT